MVNRVAQLERSGLASADLPSSDALQQAPGLSGCGFRKQQQSLTVEFRPHGEGGGSGVGIAALIRGAVDIANASRDMKPQEMEAAASAVASARVI